MADTTRLTEHPSILSEQPDDFSDEQRVFAALYQKHKQLLQLAIRDHRESARLSPEETQDILQETFLRFWKDRHRHGFIHHVAGFLKRIAKNIVLERKRDRFLAFKKLPQEVQSQDFSVSASLEQGNFSEHFEKAWAFLNHAQKHVLELHEQGCSAREIAEHLGCTENAAKQKLKRARFRFLQLLSHCKKSCALEEEKPEKCPAHKNNFYCYKSLYLQDLQKDKRK